MVTSWPASANTCAMPCPMRPAPMTAIFASATSFIRSSFPGRGAARSGAPLFRDRSKFCECYDPGSAAHRFAPRCAREKLSASRVAAVGVEDVAGVEVGCLRGEEQERAGEVFGLAEAALGHAGQEASANRFAALVIGKHPFGQRRAENRWPQCIDGDAVGAKFATKRLGDAVNGRL